MLSLLETSRMDLHSLMCWKGLYMQLECVSIMSWLVLNIAYILLLLKFDTFPESTYLSARLDILEMAGLWNKRLFRTMNISNIIPIFQNKFKLHRYYK